MMSLSEARQAMDGRYTGIDGQVESVEIDTRRLEPGALFFAIHGESANGHDYIQTALQNGAVAAVVDEDVPGAEEMPCIKVADTTKALGELAAWWRGRFNVPVIGITGSNGKTTVCRILSCLFEQERPGIAPQGSFNNHWGVPLTLLKLRQHHQSAVIEMGMNHAGELDYLGAIVRPSIGLITNAAAAHLEGLSSIEGVARAKGELIEHVAADGTMVLNRDDRFFMDWKQRAGGRALVSFGRHPESDVRLLASTGTGLRILMGGKTHSFEYGLLGEHNRLNAAAAIAVADSAGLSLAAVARGLKQVRAVKGRLESHVLGDGLLLIDDSYNANPASVKAAIDVLAEQDGERVLVLGAMGELGDDSVSVHKQVAGYAADRGIERLLTLVDQTDADYLDDMAAYLRGFGQGARAFSKVEALIGKIRARTRPLTVLVKGSRFSGMERVVEAIINEEGKRA